MTTASAPARMSFMASGALALLAQVRRAANAAGRERPPAEVLPFAREFERELEVQLDNFRCFRELLEVCRFPFFFCGSSSAAWFLTWVLMLFLAV